MENLSQEFLIANSSAYVELLENKKGEITAGAYLLYIAEIVSSVQQIRTGTLFVVNNNILDLIRGTDYVSLFNLHRKDEIGDLLSSRTAVLLKYT